MSRAFELPELLPLTEQSGQTFERLVTLMRRLLAPDGCPWDREQDEMSLRRYVLEEACEVIDAIESGDAAAIQDELGDLALQVVFLAELGRKRGAFGPDDVVSSICRKLVRRHPHVFGDVEVHDAAAVVENWETIKKQEKRGRRLLDGIPRSLPALMRAQQTQLAAAKVGFDWPDVSGSRAKVVEELNELDAAVAAGDRQHATEEFGDVLFALVNWSRHQGIDAEAALRLTCDKFRRRFEHVEDCVRAGHGDWSADASGNPTATLSLEELDSYYEEAKAQESEASAKSERIASR